MKFLAWSSNYRWQNIILHNTTQWQHWHCITLLRQSSRHHSRGEYSVCYTQRNTFASTLCSPLCSSALHFSRCSTHTPSQLLSSSLLFGKALDLTQFHFGNYLHRCCTAAAALPPPVRVFEGCVKVKCVSLCSLVCICVYMYACLYVYATLLTHYHVA